MSRALLLVALLPTVAAAQPARVALDLSLLSEESYTQLDGLSLERTCVLRLVQEGFAAVSVSTDPQVLLQLERTSSTLILRVLHAEPPISREVPLPLDPLSELHLELAQKAVELARIAARAGPPPPPQSQKPEPPPEPWAIEPSVGADGVFRLQGLDLAARVGLRVGRARGLAGQLTASVCPTRGVGMRVLELAVQLGPSYRRPLSERFDIEGGLGVGALIHDYALSDASAAAATGTRFDLLVSLPLVLSFRPVPSLRLVARVAPGFALRGREHVRQVAPNPPELLWQRGAVRVETGLGAGWSFF